MFLEYPERPKVAPDGTQIMLTCRVSIEFRVVWIIEIPGIGRFEAEDSMAISVLQDEGFIVAPSSAQDREIPLNITGSLSNNQATVECIAVNVSNNLTRYADIGGETNITVNIYGKP